MSIDISSLAQAMQSGQIRPTFLQGQYFNAGYASTPQLVPAAFYVDDATANQMANLLGGSVVKRVPETLQGTNIPLANFISLPNGQEVNAADLAQVATESSPSVCYREQALIYVIYDGVFSGPCQEVFNTDSSMQQNMTNVLTAENNKISCPGCVQAGSINGSIPASTVVNSVIPPTGPTVYGQQGNPTTTNAANTISNILGQVKDTVSNPTGETISGIPNLALLAVGLVAVWVFLKR